MPAHTLRLRAAAVAVAAALVLAACAPDLPQPAPAAVPAVPPPVMTVDQSHRVLKSIGTNLATADAAVASTGVTTRLSGPALASRAAEYAMATATAGVKKPTPLDMKAQTLVVPTTEVWPRTAFVVTEQPEDLSSPQLLVLQQVSPRSQYMLWGWARLLPGIKMPATAAPTVGSAPLPADATGLLATPKEVVARYADVLTNGDLSTYAASFASPDTYRATLVTQKEPLILVAASVGGTFAESYAPVADQTFALATADGGALVVAAMNTWSAVKFSGASIALPGDLASLSGGALATNASLRNNLTVTYSDVLAFYVPPVGASTQIQVLGAEHIRTSVTGS